MAAARTSWALSMAEYEAAIATILRTPAVAQNVQIMARGKFQPATNLVSDIFSPRAGTSIAAGQMGDRRDVKIKRMTQCNDCLGLQGRLRACHGLGLLFAPPVLAETTPSSRDAIVIEGNRRVDAETVRSYFHAAPDGRFDDAARDAALEGADRDGPVRQGFNRSHRRTAYRASDRSARARPRRIRRQQENQRTPILPPAIESKPRGTLQRAAVQADVGRIIEAYRHAGRDDVRVVPQIIDRGNGRVDLVYAMTEGAKTTGAADQFHWQPRFRQTAARRGNQDLRNQHAELSDRRRRLRPRPRRAGSRTTAAVLSQQGLCRCQRVLGKAEYDPATRDLR